MYRIIESDINRNQYQNNGSIARTQYGKSQRANKLTRDMGFSSAGVR
jgi:hypothetical protein